MDSRAARLEKYKLPTEYTEYAYSKNAVVHTTYRSEGQKRVKTEAKWTREKEVGAGAFGTIWLERNGSELRAVKSLRTRMFRVDFLREIDALAKLRDVSPPR